MFYDRDNIRGSVDNVTQRGSLKITYKLGAFNQRFQVCKARYAEAFNRSESFLDEVIKDIKAGVETSQPPLNDASAASVELVKYAKKLVPYQLLLA